MAAAKNPRMRPPPQRASRERSSRRERADDCREPLRRRAQLTGHAALPDARRPTAASSTASANPGQPSPHELCLKPNSQSAPERASQTVLVIDEEWQTGVVAERAGILDPAKQTF
ncbi:hypothetical protein NDU88_000261 [Pleurodeles waltl]|uniref:Uncharacterized protein n=1 Tax=Pleurodeles waltl TaxID=8319 RepID=A0AAV7KPG3_PLEWA|nr:hypothetical protein NDU88_000261 [Pleurodeles waltl]